MNPEDRLKRKRHNQLHNAIMGLDTAEGRTRNSNNEIGGIRTKHGTGIVPKADSL